MENGLLKMACSYRIAAMLGLRKASMVVSFKNCLYATRHIIWILFATLAYSQTNEEVFREYQFNFNLPGARANGMGGAFIGLADDATSSFTNPAGLAFLTETAVTLDWRNQHKKGQEGNISGFFNTSFDVSILLTIV